MYISVEKAMQINAFQLTKILSSRELVKKLGEDRNKHIFAGERTEDIPPLGSCPSTIEQLVHVQEFLNKQQKNEDSKNSAEK